MKVFRSGRQEAEPPTAWHLYEPWKNRRYSQCQLQGEAQRKQGSLGEALPSTLYIDITYKSVCKQIHRWGWSMYALGFRLVTCLMCANSFCGQKDCYCVPRWVPGQITFVQLQGNHAKYSSQTTDFSLFLFSSNNSPTNCFRQAFDFFKYLHATMANSVSPYVSTATEWPLNDMCTASWYKMSS